MPPELPGRLAWEIEFQEERCICDHPAAAHDDGFGCTQPAGYADTDGEPCPCLAMWEWVS